MRSITYADAISEALVQAMQRDNRVIIMGLGVDTPSHVFGTITDAHRRFPQRVIGTPIAENAMTGVALGAAIAGMRPILTHQRMDFMLMSMDQVANHLAKWSFMTAGKSRPTVVIRAVIGRSVGGGWGQAAQHAQSLEALFAYIPGLRVVMPSTPRDAKGLLLAALASDGTTIFLEHRLLYGLKGNVPDTPFKMPFGKAAIRRRGTDITIVATSAMNAAVETAVRLCARHGIDAEWIDLRCVKPWDRNAVLSSVKRTRRLLVVDTGHLQFGIGAEITAAACEQMAGTLRKARRIGLPDLPPPAGPVIERQYYPGVDDILDAIAGMCGLKGRIRRTPQAMGGKANGEYRYAF